MNILSVRFHRTTTAFNPTYNEVLTGQRAILSVRTIIANVQSTVLYGDDLYAVGLLSNLDQQTIFKNFVNSFKGRPDTWAQLSQIPPPILPYPYNPALAYTSTPPPVLPPVAHGKIEVLDSGYAPERGYWIEFLGNYFLTFPLFKNFPDVIRGGPNFTGFQASSNNNTPGGGNGSGGTSSGSGGTNCG